ncbi:MAG: YebC/PmpR family DNA-binding transcriptional regulator [Myxococcaceae bacterium]
MSGHSKWSTIKRQKGAADAKKSKVWTKILREITVAAKFGGTDPSGNPRLRKALDDARANNLSKDPIQRALAKASGKEEMAEYEELTYEGYGPAGVAVIVLSLTDNRNRTYSEVRAAFNKNGGNMGTPGSVAFGFQKKGQILLEKSENKNLTEDLILELGIDAGLDEVLEEPEGFVLTCAPESLLGLKEVLLAQKIQIASAEISMLADNPVELSTENSQILSEIIEALEDLDDVQKVWTNEA